MCAFGARRCLCVLLSDLESLRAKGALISEPRLSTPCEMRFFPREKGKTAFFQRGFFFEKAVFPFSRGKNRISQGVESRGSLISAPLALRDSKSEKLEKAGTVDFKKHTPHGRWGQGPGSVDPRFPAALPSQCPKS